jgi:hypothetical protein
VQALLMPAKRSAYFTGLLYKLHKRACQHAGAQISIIRKVKADLYGAAVHTFERDILKYAPYVEVYGGISALV